jgi:hypothetical protein
MASGGGGGTQVQRQEVDPEIKPYVTYGLEQAKSLYGRPLEYFPGQTYVSPSQYSTQAIEMAASRALEGSPLVSAAQQATQQATGYQAPTGAFQSIYGRAMGSPAMGAYGDIYSRAGQVAPDATAAGAYLGYNPFLQGTFQAAARPIGMEFQRNLAGIESQASKAGRYGSGAMAQLQTGAAEALAQNLAGLGERLGFQGYQAERGFQEAALNRQQQAQQQALQAQLQAAGGMGATQAQQLQAQLQAAQGITGAEQGAAQTRLQAAGMAPGLAEQDYAQAQRLLQAGQAQEAYQEQALGADIARFNFLQQAPYSQLQSYLGAVYGAPMGTITTAPTYRSPLAQGLGGAAAGYMLGGMVPGGQYAIPGAVAGGLLGYGGR